MKIGILYICTGKYSIFWTDFFVSCEKYFITDAEKHYFVFTDAPELEFERENERIMRIYQKNLGWPDNTLMRYKMFLSSVDKIKDMEFLFFFNANLVFVKPISQSEFLPSHPNKLVGCLHPGFYDKPSNKFPYEKNPRSTAYMRKGEGLYYFAGGINGGRSDSFLDAIREIDGNIEKDKRQGVIATWHDESHWNRYLNSHVGYVKIVSPSYLYYDRLGLPFEPKIVLRDKKALGGHFRFRNKLEPRMIINAIKDFTKKLIYYK